MSLRARRPDRHGAFSGYRVDRAIIDVGSNTVRMVLYGGAPRAPVTLFNEKVAARLGRDIATSGRLADEAVEQALRGLRRYALLLRELEVARVDLVATAAVREASNGGEFLAELRRIGFEPRLLSGEEEAQLSAMGVIGAFPGASGVVADLGGGSLELVRIGGGACGHGASLPLGTLRLPEYRKATGEKTRAALAKAIRKANVAGAAGDTLYLVGGTWRAMAVAAIEARGYPLTDPHGFTLGIEEARRLARQIARSDDRSLLAMPRISAMRAASLPDAGLLLGALLETLAPDAVVISAWGLREGILFDGLPEYARQQDPLLAGVGEFAALRGAPPLLAAQVAGWTAGALPRGGTGSERVRLASTMLALASMQVEPNFRSDLGVEWALHKRWIGVLPHERAMMAACIAANGMHLDLPAAVRELARPELLEEAICWGLAIRLCRRLGGRAKRLFQVSSLAREGDALVLSLDQSHADLFGYPNEKDLEALAGRLGCSARVEIVEPDAAVAKMPQAFPAP